MTAATTRSEATAIRLVLLWSFITTLICAVFLIFLTKGLLPDTRFTPIFRHLLITQDSHAVWLMLFITFMATLWRWPDPITHAVDWLAGNYKPVILLTFALLAVGNYYIYHDYPVSMDEYSGVFQAQTFASGQIIADLPPELVDWLILPLFNGGFFFASPITGQTVAFYWPGFALLLAPFEFLGFPWLCNPFLAALSMLLIYEITLLVCNSQRAAGWALLFTIASPAFAGNAISYYSMQAHMTANLLYVLLLLNPSTKRVVAAGLVGSLALVMHNPFRHAIFAAPWVLAMLWSKEQRRLLMPLILAYLPITVFVGLGWAWLRTSIALPAHGDASIVGSTVGAYGMPFSSLDISIIFLRLATWVKMWCWAVPGIFLIAAWSAIEHRRNPAVAKMALSVLCTLFGFAFFVTDQGHGWGNRQFHGAWGMIPILAACAMTTRQEFRQRIVSFAGCSAILSLLLLTPTYLMQMERFVSGHLAQIPEPVKTDGNFFFINTREGFYTLDMIQNHPTLKGPEIRMTYRGADANARIMQRYWPDATRVAAGPWGEHWRSPIYKPPLEPSVPDTLGTNGRLRE